MEPCIKEVEGITDIVVSLNDFLLEADIIGGGLYICQKGGMGLLTKSANKPNIYIMKKFFGYLEPIIPKEQYLHDYYYNDDKLPQILIDYLLDNDTNDNILTKVKNHINEKAKWMDKKGILAIADMTFHQDISSNYRLINKKNMDILTRLSSKYTIHILCNSNKLFITKLIDMGKLNSINGHIVTSSELGDLKCSQSGRYDIYDKFITKYNINLSTSLFIETHPGNIKAIENYSKVKNLNIKTLLYKKENRESFLNELKELVGWVGDLGGLGGFEPKLETELVSTEPPGLDSSEPNQPDLNSSEPTNQPDLNSPEPTNQPELDSSDPPTNPFYEKIIIIGDKSNILGGSIMLCKSYENINDSNGNVFCTINSFDGCVKISTDN